MALITGNSLKYRKQPNKLIRIKAYLTYKINPNKYKLLCSYSGHSRTNNIYGLNNCPICNEYINRRSK